MIKLGTAILASALGVSAFAQSGTALYMPTRNLQDQALSLKGWGSGTISQTDEVAVEGVYSLRVSTRNFFQGGFMAFGSPKDLSGSFGDKDNLLQVTYRLADGSVQLGGSGGGGGRTGGGMGTPGADSGELPSGGGGRQGGRPGGQPGHPPGGQTATTDAQLQTLRLIITTTDGKKSEAYINLRPGGGDWKKVSIPLQAINGFDKTNKTV
ncbi:MAG TPA: hypothetical protein VEX38_06455, partial [Fimbriimonadaceae bacterium]|nr:hypothetical protein [Fimbriimonadaceae bacterium]